LNGFHVNDYDTCVYSKVIEHGLLIICFTMVDMLIFSTYLDVVDVIMCFLSTSFDMKDLEETDVILGIKIMRTKEGISLNHSHYIKKILK